MPKGNNQAQVYLIFAIGLGVLVLAVVAVKTLTHSRTKRVCAPAVCFDICKPPGCVTIDPPLNKPPPASGPRNPMFKGLPYRQSANFPHITARIVSGPMAARLPSDLPPAPPQTERQVLMFIIEVRNRDSQGIGLKGLIDSAEIEGHDHSPYKNELPQTRVFNLPFGSPSCPADSTRRLYQRLSPGESLRLCLTFLVPVPFVAEFLYFGESGQSQRSRWRLPPKLIPPDPSS